MANEQNNTWANFTLPKMVGENKPSLHEFKRNDGKEMAEITLPPHYKVTTPNGEEKDVSFYKLVLPKSAVKEFDNDPSNYAIGMPLANKEGEPWNVTLVKETGAYEHPEATGKDRGEFKVFERTTVNTTSEQFEADMRACREERAEFAKANERAEQAPEEKAPAKKAPAKRKGSTLREDGAAAQKASEQLAKEAAKSAPEKDKGISIDSGVAIG